MSEEKVQEIDQSIENKPAPPSGPKRPEKEPQLENLDEIFKRISDDFSDVAPLQHIAQKFNVNPGQLVLGIIFVAFTLTIFGAGNLLVKILIGILYPAYMSVQCVKQKDDAKSKMWLSYWVIYLLMFLLDRVMWFAFHDLLQLYFPIKNMTLIWMYYPKTRGAIIIFDKLVLQLNQLGLLEKPKQKHE
ncbi:unnamed protein product (macronuclear) [Paramecium tetraurelia]|uniref:Receptor expression-enhancing protein n=1 Tax=Paramecium tetraurelia TaxID=5888 RepID=A0E4Y7_PARTE|nr:uncharacterized protein GSPATT00023530001 [Paramecium tetraurelia]CAK90354.1 unnamed protein product [Paramecium tetraurelia]|eukprot:XP_001457751.1 hypothetical protein (macronuclear) [Paramecium tetraurelia strain d4-2]